MPEALQQCMCVRVWVCVHGCACVCTNMHVCGMHACVHRCGAYVQVCSNVCVVYVHGCACVHEYA